MKLYKVNLRGMKIDSGSGMVYGISYVIAEDSNQAYQKVKKFLDDNDIGFSKDRELKSVELIADSNQYNDCGIILYI